MCFTTQASLVVVAIKKCSVELGASYPFPEWIGSECASSRYANRLCVTAGKIGLSRTKDLHAFESPKFFWPIKALISSRHRDSDVDALLGALAEGIKAVSQLDDDATYGLPVTTGLDGRSVPARAEIELINVHQTPWWE